LKFIAKFFVISLFLPLGCASERLVRFDNSNWYNFSFNTSLISKYDGSPWKTAEALLEQEKYKEICPSSFDILEFRGYLQGGRSSFIIACIEDS
jgi:hypothetical protein